MVPVECPHRLKFIVKLALSAAKVGDGLGQFGKLNDPRLHLGVKGAMVVAESFEVGGEPLRSGVKNADMPVKRGKTRLGGGDLRREIPQIGLQGEVFLIEPGKMRGEAVGSCVEDLGQALGRGEPGLGGVDPGADGINFPEADVDQDIRPAEANLPGLDLRFQIIHARAKVLHQSLNRVMLLVQAGEMSGEALGSFFKNLTLSLRAVETDLGMIQESKTRRDLPLGAFDPRDETVEDLNQPDKGRPKQLPKAAARRENHGARAIPGFATCVVKLKCAHGSGLAVRSDQVGSDQIRSDQV